MSASSPSGIVGITCGASGLSPPSPVALPRAELRLEDLNEDSGGRVGTLVEFCEDISQLILQI